MNSINILLYSFKEQINEKVRKNGGWTLFNQWIVTEMNTLINFIQTIKSQLQVKLRLKDSRNIKLKHVYLKSLYYKGDKKYD